MSQNGLGIRRFFAFLFDLFLFTAPIQIAWTIIDPAGFVAFSTGAYGLSYAMLKACTAIPLIALCTRLLGTTPGKWLLGLRVELPENAGFTAVFKRTMLSFVVGAGAQMGYFALFFYFFSYRTLKDTGSTAWDKRYETKVLAKTIGRLRIAAFVILFLAGETLVNLPATYDLVIQTNWQLTSPIMGVVSVQSGSLNAELSDFTLTAEGDGQVYTPEFSQHVYSFSQPLSSYDCLVLTIKPTFLPELPAGLTLRLPLPDPQAVALTLDLSLHVICDPEQTTVSLSVYALDRASSDDPISAYLVVPVPGDTSELTIPLTMLAPS